MTDMIFSEEEETNTILEGNPEHIHTIKGRTFEVSPLGADKAMDLLDICIETFGPSLARAVENLDSLSMFTASEAKLASEPLMLLGESFKNKRFIKAMSHLVPYLVKENGANVDYKEDFKGELGIYLQLCWIIVKENILNAFIECMEMNGIDLTESMQQIHQWGQTNEESKEGG